MALEKEVWRRGIELQCQTFARALEAYDAELARQYAGKQEVERGDTSGPLLQGELGLRPCWYFVRVYINTPGAGRAGPGGVGGTTPAAVVPGVEHAGDRVRLPGP